jgi:O-antigen/teichoic acid export membrane protein
VSKATFTQKLFVHGGVYALSRFLNQLAGFLLLPVLARYLGRDGYGMLSLATTVASITSIFLMQGLNGSWFRLRFKYRDSELHAFDSTILWHVLGSYTLGIGLLCVVGPTLAAQWLPGVPFFPILLLALLVETGTELIGLFQRKEQAEQKPKRFLVLALSRNGLSLAMALTFVAALERGASGKLEGELLAVGGICFWLMVALRPLPPWKADTNKLKESLRYGLPLVPHQLAGTINSVADRALINYFVGLGSAGLYAMGYKLVSVAFVISTSLNQAFSSLVYESLTGSEALADAERHQRLAAIQRSALYFVTAIACCLLGICALGRETLVIMASHEFEAAWELLPILSAGILLLSAYQPLSNMIIFNNQVKWLPIATIVSALLNIGLNVILLPRVGVIGAAWATLLSNLALFGITVVVSTRFAQTYQWRKLATIICASAAGFTLIWWLDATLNDIATRLVSKIGALAFLMLVLLWLSGVALRDLQSLYRIGRKSA